MQSSAEIGRAFGHVAAMLHRQTDQILQERLGIGLSQFNILTNLQKRPQTKQRTLADVLGQTEASVSRQITLLRQKGLLVSHLDPAERRQHLTALTAKGAKIVIAAQEVLEQFYDQLLGPINDREQTQLQTLINRLHEQSCAPGKRIACDRPGDIETIYASQSPQES